MSDKKKYKMLKKINKIIHRFEQSVIFILVFLMAIILFFSTIELSIFIFKEIQLAVTIPDLLLDKKEMLKIFSLFFNVLISLELFETVRLYLKENIFHVEFILLVALIAIARKIIILEYNLVSPLLLFAIGWLILALAVGYYLVKTGQSKNKNTTNKNE